jgi:Holin of 3TMs, for gene-transfer release
MGLIGTLFGAGPAVAQVGQAVGGVAEILIGNRAERDAAQSAQMQAAMAQLGLEFEQPATGGFDRFVDALNRLPRPMLVLATFALFGYCMVDPVSFAGRMQSLGLVPDPLWWLLGAIVSFYFGARELHYQRSGKPVLPLRRVGGAVAGAAVEPFSQAVPKPAARSRAAAPAVAVRAADPNFNAAVEEWRQQRR